MPSVRCEPWAFWHLQPAGSCNALMAPVARSLMHCRALASSSCGAALHHGRVGDWADSHAASSPETSQGHAGRHGMRLRTRKPLHASLRSLACAADARAWLARVCARKRIRQLHARAAICAHTAFATCGPVHASSTHGAHALPNLAAPAGAGRLRHCLVPRRAQVQCAAMGTCAPRARPQAASARRAPLLAARQQAGAPPRASPRFAAPCAAHMPPRACRACWQTCCSGWAAGVSRRV
jgi:hypothetical protein